MFMEAPHIISLLAVAAESTDTLPTHNIADFKYGSVQIHGTFVGTIQLEVSNDKVVWVNLGGAETTPGITEYNFNTEFIRANITARASGSISATLIGKR